jgi:hypothetical protein
MLGALLLVAGFAAVKVRKMVFRSGAELRNYGCGGMILIGGDWKYT